MVLGEYLNRLFDQVLHPSFNDLLALRLDDVIRVVLTHFLIGGGRKTDDAGGTGMADVNSDEHGPHVVHSLRKLQVEKVTLDLRIDLAENVACLAHVEGTAIARGDYLGWDAELLEQLFVHFVVVLVAENDHDNFGVTEDAVGACHHVLKKFVLHLRVVFFRLYLNEVRFLNLDFQHAARLLKRVEDVVSNFVVGAVLGIGALGVLVNHNPLIPIQIYSLLDG